MMLESLSAAGQTFAYDRCEYNGSYRCATARSNEERGAQAGSIRVKVTAKSRR